MLDNLTTLLFKFMNSESWKKQQTEVPTYILKLELQYMCIHIY